MQAKLTNAANKNTATELGVIEQGADSVECVQRVAAYRGFCGGSRGGGWEGAEEIQGRVYQSWALITVWNTSSTIRHCRAWRRGIYWRVDGNIIMIVRV